MTSQYMAKNREHELKEKYNKYSASSYLYLSLPSSKSSKISKFTPWDVSMFMDDEALKFGH